jgi:hypothetical protein
MQCSLLSQLSKHGLRVSGWEAVFEHADGRDEQRASADMFLPMFLICVRLALTLLYVVLPAPPPPPSPPPLPFSQAGLAPR